MTGGVVLGGVSALLAFWLFMSSLEGLGYAVPMRPSVIVPERWAEGAKLLLWIILAGLVASVLVPMVLGEELRLTFFHFIVALGALLPIWEIIAANMYGDSFVVVNGRQEVVRPIIVAAVNKVFGDMFEEEDMLYSVEPKNKDWQLIPHEREHLLVLDPHYKVPRRERRQLELALRSALTLVKPAGFNVRSFYISFFLPLLCVMLYGGIAYALLHKLVEVPLHGTVGG